MINKAPDKAIFKTLLSFLYGEESAAVILPRLMNLLSAYDTSAGEEAAGNPVPGAPAVDTLTQGDALLITYADMLSPPERKAAAANTAGTEAASSGETALARLRHFLEKRNRAFTFLHILPFHPYSSDDGFSVIDYRRVDERFGSWEDMEYLRGLSVYGGKKLKPVFDFVVNHGSVQSEWFKGFLEGKAPYPSWYITRPKNYDWSAVVRPRTHPLLTPFTRRAEPAGNQPGSGGPPDAETVYVWTTFSADQADYDFSNPEVLLEFVTILLEYVRRGAAIVRLDAVAYLWKEDNTPCLHHPKTHGVVKLFRAVIDYLHLPLLLLTETNVPHEENISYFGKAGPGPVDSLPEAHMVYNFALPPLALYAVLSGDAGPLRSWAQGLASQGFASGGAAGYFLNFLASHDGVGLTPARGLVDEAAFAGALEEAKRRGALVSYKSTPGGEIPYELNCSFASVTAPPGLGPPELRARAFLAPHGVLLSLPGLPAIYFHSWIGSEAWSDGPGILGYNRAINREKPALDRVEKELEDPGSFRFHVYRGLNRLLEFRREEAAFHPDAAWYVPDAAGERSRSVFALVRAAAAHTADPGARQAATVQPARIVLCLENLSGAPAVWKKPDRFGKNAADASPDETAQTAGAAFANLSAPADCSTITEFPLAPWETLWIVYEGGAEVKRLSTV